jgi:tetratricopeptide (TPR) repeat protein
MLSVISRRTTSAKGVLGMGSNKEKMLRSAEKHLAQGNIPAAIQEYRRVVDLDKWDVNALSMLGDLYLRVNNNDEAVACFKLLGELYQEQSARAKAIAVYKKVDRLKPGSPDVAARLAVLYAETGQVADACAQYHIVAESSIRSGQIQKAVDVLTRILDLNISDAEAQLKLAEAYLRQDFRFKAGENYAEAGRLFLAKQNYERALWAYTQAHALRPTEYDVLHGLVAVHQALGTLDQIVTIIEKGVAGGPNEERYVFLLARTYAEVGNDAAVEKTIEKLLKMSPSSYRGFLDIIRLYVKKDKCYIAMRLLALVAESFIKNRDPEPILEILREVLKRNPKQLNALHLLARVRSAQYDAEKLIATLDRIVKAAKDIGLHNEERIALGHLVQLAPAEQSYKDRLIALGGPVPEGNGYNYLKFFSIEDFQGAAPPLEVKAHDIF